MVANPKKAAAAKTSTKKTKKEDDEEEYKQQTSSRVDKSQIHKAVAALRLHLDKVKQEKEKKILYLKTKAMMHSVLISLQHNRLEARGVTQK